MANNPSAANLRHWAIRCAAEAAATTNETERERLLKMREALLVLAGNEDWLNGATADAVQPHGPPAGAGVPQQQR